jgi:hypothetical protein
LEWFFDGLKLTAHFSPDKTAQFKSDGSAQLHRNMHVEAILGILKANLLLLSQMKNIPRILPLNQKLFLVKIS